MTISRGGFDGHIIYLGITAASAFTRDIWLDILSKIRVRHPQEPIIASHLADDAVAKYEALDSLLQRSCRRRANDVDHGGVSGEFRTSRWRVIERPWCTGSAGRI